MPPHEHDYGDEMDLREFLAGANVQSDHVVYEWTTAVNTILKLHQTFLAKHAMKTKQVLYSMEPEGFCLLGAEDFVKSIAPDTATLAATSGDKQFIYTDARTLIEVSSYDVGSQKKVSLNLDTLDEALFIKIRKFCDENFYTQPRRAIGVISANKHGLGINHIECPNHPLMADNYTPEVNASYQNILKNFSVEKPNGRLVVINGPPGTGKTWMVRGLISELKDVSTVIFPPQLVSEISSPQLVSLFLDKRKESSLPLVLVLEDADDCLAERSSSNMSYISALLNNTDGILGNLLDIRIVATTNAAQLDIEPALLRSGRLLAQVYVGPVSAEQATKIHGRLTESDGKTFDHEMTLAEIYEEASLTRGVLAEKVKPVKKRKKKVGF